MGLVFGSAGACAAQLRAGFTYTRFPGDTASRGDASGRLSVIIWYPAPVQTAVRAISVGPPKQPYFVEGQGAQDAPLVSLPQKLPLIVVSHGTGGTMMDLAWLCAALAARGYVVAAVNHPGNNALAPPTVIGNTVLWLRAADVSRVIDGVLTLSRFGPRVDRARIGALGVSLGGFTVLAIAGARADSRLLAAYCTRKRQTPVCSGQATPEMPNLRSAARALATQSARYRAAVAADRNSHRDRRVRAVFAIAPAQGPATVPNSLTAVEIPVAFVAGFGDRIVPVQDNVIPDALGIPNAQLTLLPRPVGHYSFLMNCTSAGRRKYRAVCADAGSARLVAHRTTLELVTAFFARVLGAAL